MKEGSGSKHLNPKDAGEEEEDNSSLLRNEEPPHDEEDPLAAPSSSAKVEPLPPAFEALAQEHEQEQSPIMSCETSERTRIHRLVWREEREPLSRPMKIGIGVGVLVAALLALILGLVLGRKKDDGADDMSKLLSEILQEPTADDPKGTVISTIFAASDGDDDSDKNPRVLALRFVQQNDVLTQQMLTEIQSTPRESTKQLLKTQIRERYALTLLYFATNGDTSWSNQNQWLHNTTHQCQWQNPPSPPTGDKDQTQQQEVSLTDWCHKEDYSNQTYRALIQSGNNLSGTVPEEFFRYVRGLEDIDLSNNSIGGKFNDVVRYMPPGSNAVKHLVLNNNKLTGNMDELPIDHRTFLFSLFLGHNQLTGKIHPKLGDLPYLNNLGLSFNQLTGPIPSSLGAFSLSNLEDLFLDNNLLTGTLPTTLAWRATSLRHVWLHNNRFNGPIPSQFGDLGDGKSLKTLFLANNKLTGTIPSQLYKLKVLELDLSNNSLEGTIGTQLSNMKRLQVLRLANNSLEGSIPYDVISKLKNLQELDLSGNPKLTGSIPSSLCSNLVLNFDCSDDNNICGCNCTCGTDDTMAPTVSPTSSPTTAAKDTTTTTEATDAPEAPGTETTEAPEATGATEAPEATDTPETAPTTTPTTTPTTSAPTSDESEVDPTNNDDDDDDDNNNNNNTTDPCMVVESFELVDLNLARSEAQSEGNSSLLGLLGGIGGEEIDSLGPPTLAELSMMLTLEVSNIHQFDIEYQQDEQQPGTITVSVPEDNAEYPTAGNWSIPSGTLETDTTNMISIPMNAILSLSSNEVQCTPNGDEVEESCPVARCESPPDGCQYKDDHYILTEDGAVCCPALCYAVFSNGTECSSQEVDATATDQIASALVTGGPISFHITGAMKGEEGWDPPGTNSFDCLVEMENGAAIGSEATTVRCTHSRWKPCQ